MGVSKTVTTIIDAGSLTGGGTLVSSGVDLSAAIDFSVGLVVNFPSSANGNLKFELFGDPTSTSQNFSIGAYDIALDSGEMWYANGAVVRGVYPMVKFPKYVKVRLTNLGTLEISSVTVYAIVQTA